MFNVMPELKNAGWDPVPFAVRFKANEKTRHDDQFADPPVNEDYLLYGDKKLTLREKFRMGRKVLYDGPTRRLARSVIRKNDCRALYALQIAHYLYPEVILAAADCDVPAVIRLSDFQMICPSYSMFRQGHVCDKCKTSLLFGAAHRCLKDSFSVSMARVTAMTLHRLMGVADLAGAFVCPSRFMKEKMSEAGFDPEKLVHIPTPISRELENLEPTRPFDDGYALYVGGMYEAKGPQVAIKSAMDHGFPLVLAAGIETPLGHQLSALVQKSGAKNITFAGFAKGKKLAQLYQGARCVVIPSMWYENSPNTALESMAHARAVVASDLGSLPENVIHDKTGLLFAPGDSDALAEKVTALFSDQPLAKDLGQNARRHVLANHTMNSHLRRLTALFEGLS